MIVLKVDRRPIVLGNTTGVPLRRERVILLGLLLALATGAWAWLIWQAPTMGGPGMGLTMGLGPALFLTVWIVMMVAMMFPAAAPMVLAFLTITRHKRAQGSGFVPVWVFVGAYLLIWALAGLLAYGLALTADNLGRRVM